MSEEPDWIEWSGGECPVGEFTPCEVKLRGTYDRDGEPRHHWFKTVRPHELPALWAWTHTGDNRDGDVIAYRVIPHPFMN